MSEELVPADDYSDWAHKPEPKEGLDAVVTEKSGHLSDSSPGESFDTALSIATNAVGWELFADGRETFQVEPDTETAAIWVTGEECRQARKVAERVVAHLQEAGYL